MSIGKHTFNLSLCFLEPKSINSALSGLSLRLLADIHLEGICSTYQKQLRHSYATDGHKVVNRQHRNEFYAFVFTNKSTKGRCVKRG